MQPSERDAERLDDCLRRDDTKTRVVCETVPVSPIQAKVTAKAAKVSLREMPVVLIACYS